MNQSQREIGIRPARGHEAGQLSSLALRSKAHWDYTPEQLAVFRGELTLTEAQIATDRAHVADRAGAIVGFYTWIDHLDPSGPRTAELDHLFVAPEEIGTGIGTLLYTHACRSIQEQGYEGILIQSDPNAAGFYLRHGATEAGAIPSSIPGRSIPLFRQPLAPAASRPGEGKSE